MKRMHRIYNIIFACIIILALGIGGWLCYFIHAPMPKVKGTLKIAGLIRPVEIYRDNMGIPQIYAENPHDLYFAQGYVHAQDRFVQMELGRRLAAGRLSEVFGSMIVEVDRYVRILGLPRVVKQEEKLLDPNTRTILQSYADGVNAYLGSHKKLGLELELLGLQGVRYTPDPWTVSDSISWLKVMAMNISANMNTELRNVAMIQTMGAGSIREIWPLYPKNRPLIIPKEVNYKALKIGDLQAQTDMLKIARKIAGIGIGSNSWALSGKLTDTGKPYLANDPHLGIQIPSVWYEVGLHCKTPAGLSPDNITGVSFAGMPGVIIGHNDRIAWGFTILPADVQDLYIERVHPDNPHQYKANGKWVDFEMIHETILVRGKLKPQAAGSNANPPLNGAYDPVSGFTKVILPVRLTRHGPVIDDFSAEVRSLKGLFGSTVVPDRHVTALRWTALEPGHTIQAVYKLNRAQNFKEFREALKDFDNPAQNAVYADIDGNIGFQSPGKIPVRSKGDGQLPVPGWNGEYEWQGYIPFEELPYSYNPPEGYIVAANNDVAGPGYPYLISLEWDPGSRAQRIIDLLKKTSGRPINRDYIQKMQNDVFNMPAQQILQYLGELHFDDPELQEALDYLCAWDCHEYAESGAAAFYAIFWMNFMKTVFMNKLPPGQWPLEEAVALLMTEPENHWWDDPATPNVVEKRDDVLRKSFVAAYHDARQRMGSNKNRWAWNKLHVAVFKNSIMGSIPVVSLLFNRGPFPVPGGPGVINSYGWAIGNQPNALARSAYEVTWIPSMRMIVDFNDFDNSLMIQSLGQSGHPFHPHYNDMLELWRRNQYHPQLWNRSAVRNAAESHLSFIPQ